MSERTKGQAGFRTRPTLTASALSFEFVAPMTLNAAIARLKMMTITEPQSDIAFFRIDADVQRFYLKTRAFRSPLIEAQGMLRRTGEEQTEVSGDIFGDVLFTPLVVAFIIGVIVVVLVTFNFWLLMLGLLGTGILLVYWRSVAARTAADKAQLAQLIREALTPEPTEP